jgi:hypothetical protein
MRKLLMNTKISLTIAAAAAVLSIAAAAAPAQAATRLMNSSLEGFEYRCEAHGGLFGQDDELVICQTPSVPVACEFTAVRQAVCQWPGIENQIAVIRVIGTLPLGTHGSLGGNGGLSANMGNGGGGGLQGPQDFAPAPQNDPHPNFNGPQDFQMAP